MAFCRDSFPIKISIYFDLIIFFKFIWSQKFLSLNLQIFVLYEGFKYLNKLEKSRSWSLLWQKCQSLCRSYKPIKAALQKHINIRHENYKLPIPGLKSIENMKQEASTPPTSLKKLAFGKIIFKCKHCDCKCKSNFSIILHLKNKHSIERKDSEQHFERWNIASIYGKVYHPAIHNFITSTIENES